MSADQLIDSVFFSFEHDRSAADGRDIFKNVEPAPESSQILLKQTASLRR
jgi:hypothetical protein